MRALIRAIRARPCSGVVTLASQRLQRRRSGSLTRWSQKTTAASRSDGLLHDTRRYVSTTLNERLGVEPHIVEVILAHLPEGRLPAFTIAAQYALEKRRALDKLADSP